MAPNEVFARLVLSELSSKDRPLMWKGRIDFDAIEEFEAYASSGERALLNLFWAAWRCEGIAEVFGRCDVQTSRTVLGGLIAAYAGQFGLDVTVSAAPRPFEAIQDASKEVGSFRMPNELLDSLGVPA